MQARLQVYEQKVDKTASAWWLFEHRPATQVNVAAANRFISHALPELSPDQRRALQQVYARPPTVLSARPNVSMHMCACVSAQVLHMHSIACGQRPPTVGIALGCWATSKAPAWPLHRHGLILEHIVSGAGGCGAHQSAARVGDG